MLPCGYTGNKGKVTLLRTHSNVIFNPLIKSFPCKKSREPWAVFHFISYFPRCNGKLIGPTRLEVVICFALLPYICLLYKSVVYSFYNFPFRSALIEIQTMKLSTWKR